ncbi:MAG: hypothetical protein JXA25_05965 [Anaerolineales bacterium]|nr:hypothetical protein [Anaerolineales bacterium]
MTRIPGSRKQPYVFLIHCIPAILLSFSCILSDFARMEVSDFETKTEEAWENSIQMTNTEYYRGYNMETAAAWQAAETARIATSLSRGSTAQAAEETTTASYRQTEEAPKPPVITGISFPAEIPGNQSTIIGLLYFTDPDGDISRVDYTVISATNFGAGKDEHPKLDSGSWTDGAIKIYVWCDGQQTVTLQAQMFDKAGNSSNQMRFTFTCK